MSKKKNNEPRPDETDPSEPPKKKKKPRFLDSWQALALFVGTILLVRFFVFEPFKIPSGSMEPTLIGHEDYGDRIVADKLAFLGKTNPRRFDVVVFKYDSRWEKDAPKREIKNYIKRLVGLPGDTLVISGGDLFLADPKSGEERILRKWEYSEDLQRRLWQPVARAAFREKPLPPLPKDAGWREKLARQVVQDENRRAFPWTIQADGGGAPPVKRTHNALIVKGPLTLTYAHRVTNVYVKMGRWPFLHIGCPMAHLPPKLVPNGVKVRDPREKTEHIRPYLPDTWEGVRCPNCGRIRFPLEREPGEEPRIVPAAPPLYVKARVLDWQGGASGRAELKLRVQEGALMVGDVILLDSGARLAVKEIERREGGAGESASELVSGQEGIIRGPSNDTQAVEVGKDNTWYVIPPETGPFFYGGYNTVGDLKLDLELETLANGGAVELAVGSSRHHAAWIVSLGGKRPAPPKIKGRHECPEAPFVEAGKKHVLSLAYVDGTVRAAFDGQAFPPLKVPVKPLGPARIKSLARVRFLGKVRVRITRLDLYRDLFHTLYLDHKDGSGISEHDGAKRFYRPEEGRYKFEIPADCFLMLGDNSPSSKDGRVWGFVPRANLVGRASFVWWPPARCRIMY